MSISASSHESNKFYESNSRDKFRAVLFKALGVLVREPAEGYDRTYRKTDYRDIPYWEDGKDGDIQIDILGHVNEEVNFPLTANNDTNNTDWKVFILNTRTSPHNNSNNKNTHSENVVSANIFISDSPEKPPENYTSETSLDNIRLEMESTAKFKYVIGEVTAGGRKSLGSKITQLEKDCKFICSKVSMRNSTTNYSVSQIISFVMIIAPSESANNVSGIVENNAMVYPLLYQLLCEGRFLYIVNKETTTEILKQVREETVIFKDQFQEQSQQVEQLRGDLDEFKDGTLNRLDETNTRLDETNTLLDETNTRLNEFKEDTLNRLDQMQAMLELILKKLHGTSDL